MGIVGESIQELHCFPAVDTAHHSYIEANTVLPLFKTVLLLV